VPPVPPVELLGPAGGLYCGGLCCCDVDGVGRVRVGGAADIAPPPPGGDAR